MLFQSRTRYAIADGFQSLPGFFEAQAEVWRIAFRLRLRDAIVGQNGVLHKAFNEPHGPFLAAREFTLVSALAKALS